MENKILEQVVKKLKDFKRVWGLKETGKRDRFLAYKKNILTKIELILASREKEAKYIEDIKENSLQVYKITDLDLLDAYSKEKVVEDKPVERQSPLLP